MSQTSQRSTTQIPVPLLVSPVGAQRDATNGNGPVQAPASGVQFVTDPFTDEQLRGLESDAAQVIARYPQPRSALLPLLYLVQSVQGYVSADGLAFCARVLGITTAQVAGVASFYTMYRRKPCGTYSVGVCTNTLCAVMGGDEIYARLREHLGLPPHHDTPTPAGVPARGTQLHHPQPELSADGSVSLEHLECNAACDYAPVVMVNWEFFDNQTPESAVALVDALLAGQPPQPTRGASLRSFAQTQRVLAGFYDGRADEGPSAGAASLAGLRVARGEVAVQAAAPGQPPQPQDQAEQQAQQAETPAPTSEPAEPEVDVDDLDTGSHRLQMRAHKAQHAGQAGQIPHEQSKDLSGAQATQSGSPLSADAAEAAGSDEDEELI